MDAKQAREAITEVFRHAYSGIELGGMIEGRERSLLDQARQVLANQGIPERILNVGVMPSWAIDAGRD